MNERQKNEQIRRRMDGSLMRKPRTNAQIRRIRTEHCDRCVHWRGGCVAFESCPRERWRSTRLMLRRLKCPIGKWK